MDHHFWTSPLNQLLHNIETYLGQHKSTTPHIAAFDADGTCWFNNVGRDYFVHQCHGIFKNQYTWQDYLDREAENVEEALWWLAEVNQGRTTEDLIQEATEALDCKSPIKLIPSTQKLIQQLLQWKVKVYIVTASVKWSVIPATRQLGIPDKQVLGVTTEITPDGRLSQKRLKPLTWTSGKPQALLQNTQGIAPFLCMGNSITDLQLLQSATHFKGGIRTTDPSNSLSRSETQLMDICHKNHWIHFDYFSHTS